MTKSKARKIRPSRHNQLPEELENYLGTLAKEAAGKPLSESLLKDHPMSQLIGRFVELALEAEMAEHLGYERHERQPKATSKGRRANTRNGRSSKTLKTSHGLAPIDVPRDRQGTFAPQIIEKHQTMTAQIENQVLSLYTKGLTEADIARHVADIYHIDANSMLVSRIVQSAEPELKAWRNRPLDSTYAILFIDAFYASVRHTHGVESTAVYTVCGYGELGVLEVLGVYMAPEEQGPKESASFWHRVLIELQGRGLKTALMVCADGLTGLGHAVKAVWPRVRFVPCVVHMVRASNRHVSYKDRRAVCKDLKAIYNAPTFEAAEMALEAFEQTWGGKYGAVVEQWKAAMPSLAQLWTYGPALRRLVYTTNPIENVNRQVRKVSKNRGVLPSQESALRLFTLVLRDIDDKARSRGVRPDWRVILTELHIHFADQLEAEWGWRRR